MARFWIPILVPKSLHNSKYIVIFTTFQNWLNLFYQYHCRSTQSLPYKKKPKVQQEMKLFLVAASALAASLVMYKKQKSNKTRLKRTHVAHADQDIFHHKLVWICDNCKKCILGILYFQEEDHALCESCFSTLPLQVRFTYFKSRVYISRELALKGTLQMLVHFYMSAYLFY